jgi:hypothetical protein
MGSSVDADYLPKTDVYTFQRCLSAPIFSITNANPNLQLEEAAVDTDPT